MAARVVQWEAREGEAYSLVFSFLAIESLKDQWKCASTQEVGQRLQTLSEGMDFAVVRDLIWAAMRTNHEEKTPTDVMKLLDSLGFDELPNIVTMLSELVQNSMPEPGRGGPPRVATGKR